MTGIEARACAIRRPFGGGRSTHRWTYFIETIQIADRVFYWNVVDGGPHAKGRPTILTATASCGTHPDAMRSANRAVANYLAAELTKGAAAATHARGTQESA